MLSDLDVARSAAETAAEIVRQGFGEARSASYKGAVNPVTETDQRAERAILEVLTRHRPADAVLAEEGGGAGWSSPRVWIVDPLDGTVNFVHGIPQIGVSVALWDAGAPVVGVVIDVLRNETFSARRGEGAFLNGTQITCSTEAEIGRSLIATGFPYDRQEHAHRYAGVVASVLERFQGIRRLGSAALDICWVACGRFEGYWEFGLGPWDAAAAVLIAGEAGARVSTPDGHDFRLDDKGLVVANPLVHRELAATVFAERPSHLA